MDAKARVEMEQLLRAAKQGTGGMVEWSDLCNQALIAAALGRADDYEGAVELLARRAKAKDIIRAVRLAGQHMLEIAQQDESGEE